MTGFFRCDRALVLALSISVCFLVESEAEPVCVDHGALSHGFKCTKVTIPNSRQIILEEFNYDGKGPLSFFAVGKAEGDDYKTESGGTFVNAKVIPYATVEGGEPGKCETAPEYDGKKSATLTLPTGMKVTDFDYVILNCYQAVRVFGYIDLKGITAPPDAGPDVAAVEECPRPIPTTTVGPGQATEENKESFAPANLAAFWLIVILPSITATKNFMN